MSGEVAKLREGVSYGDRFRALQKEVSGLVDAAGVSIRAKMYNLAEECEAAQALPIRPGEKEIIRQMCEALRTALDRMEALGGRK